MIYPTDPKASRKNCKIKMIINSIFSLHLGANHEENSGNRTRKTAPLRITASVQLKMTTAANRNDSLFVAFQPMGILSFCRSGGIALFLCFFFSKNVCSLSIHLGPYLLSRRVLRWRVVSYDSTRGFKVRINLRGNRGLRTVYGATN